MQRLIRGLKLVAVGAVVAMALAPVRAAAAELPPSVHGYFMHGAEAEFQGEYECGGTNNTMQFAVTWDPANTSAPLQWSFSGQMCGDCSGAVTTISQHGDTGSGGITPFVGALLFTFDSGPIYVYDPSCGSNRRADFQGSSFLTLPAENCGATPDGGDGCWAYLSPSQCCPVVGSAEVDFGWTDQGWGVGYDTPTGAGVWIGTEVIL